MGGPTERLELDAACVPICGQRRRFHFEAGKKGSEEAATAIEFFGSPFTRWRPGRAFSFSPRTPAAEGKNGKEQRECDPL